MTAPRINAPVRWRRPGRAMTRADYARLARPELERRLAGARDRMTRADDEAAYLADAFAAQEIEAVLHARTCPACGEASAPDEAHGETWQQWRCPCCGSWNDKPEERTD